MCCCLALFVYYFEVASNTWVIDIGCIIYVLN
jgi:hypothetical protein